MKKSITFFMALMLIVSFLIPSASALFDSGSVTSELLSNIYYMENLDEGTVFFEKDSTKQTPAAGFIKVIAAVVAIEKWGNLDGDIKINKKNLNFFDYEDGMTVVGYEEGETVSKRELFNFLVACSANDALSIIGYEVSGSLDAFIAEMQNLVVKIGCTSTVVKNIHGFDDPGQYTTAADVAKIIKYALQYPEFAEAFAIDEIVIKVDGIDEYGYEIEEEVTFQSSNKMRNAAIADYYHSAVTGGKQTSTDLAGECIAVISNADGYSYLTVVMDGRYEDIDEDYYDENTCMTDAQQMLDWVYENIRYRVIASPEQAVATVDVVAGKDSDKLRLVPEKETSALVPSMASPASVMFEFVEGTMPEKVTAPVKAGDIIAQANVYYAGQKLTTVNLVAEEDVKLSFGGLMLSGLKTFLGSIFMLVITFIAAAIAVLRFALDLKDYLDKDRRKSYEELPSSFEVLVEKVKKAVSGKDKKKKSSAPAKKKPAPRKAAPKKSGAPEKKKTAPSGKRPVGSDGKSQAQKKKTPPVKKAGNGMGVPKKRQPQKEKTTSAEEKKPQKQMKNKK